MALGDIDLSLKPIKPEIWLAKPDENLVAKLNGRMGIGFSRFGKRNKFLKHTQLFKLGNINEMVFALPYEIIKNHKLIRNPAVDLIRERYYLKVLINNEEEWYVITEIEDSMDGQMDSKTVTAKSRGYELADRVIRQWDVVSVNLHDALMGGTTVDKNGNNVPFKGLLEGTLWTIGDTVDSTFNLIYRSFNFSSTTVLDALIQVAITFNAVIVWDTVNRKINFQQLDNIGLDKGFKITLDNYMKSVDYQSKSDDLITRFKPYGKNGLTINSANTTGEIYLDDYSYYLYPFQRDSNKNVIQSSYYMSDSLAGAILDYNALVSSKSGQYSSLLSQLSSYQTTLTSQQNTLTNDQTALASTQASLDIAQSTGTDASALLSQQSTQQSQIATDQANIDATNANIASLTLTITVNSGATASGNIQFNIDGKKITVALVSGDSPSTVASKINSQFNLLYPTYKSTVSTNVVTVTYYTTESYESAVLSFSDVGTTAANATISAVDHGIQNQISTLQIQISANNNFTSAQLTELNKFIKEKEWSNSNIADAKSLLDAANIEFAKYKNPQITVKVDIVDLLEMVYEQRNWDKISLGDTIEVRHKNIGIDIKAKIIEISFDHNEGNIQLTIANVKDLLTDEEKILKMLYQGVGASATIGINADNWNTITDLNGTVNDLYLNGISAAKTSINSAVDDTVTIDNRGITITSSSDKKKFVRMTNGVIGLTQDGGNTFGIAIDSGGIYASKLVGQIIAGVNLTIANQAGTFSVDGNGVTISGTSLTITSGLPDSQISSAGSWNNAANEAANSVQLSALYNGVKIDSTNGIVVTRSDNRLRAFFNASDGIRYQSSPDGSTWVDRFYYDAAGGNLVIDGVIKARDFQINGASVLVNSGTKINGSYINQITTDQLVAGSAKIGSALIQSITTDQIVAGSAKISNALIQNIKTDQIIIGTSGIGDSLISSGTKWNNRTTLINDSGIYTGSLTASQINAISGISLGSGATIDWNYVTAPAYGQVTGTKPPTNADNTLGVIGTNRLTYIDQYGIYTGTLTAQQVNAVSINADSITAGTLTGRTVRTAASGSRLEITSSGLSSYASDGTLNGVILDTSTSTPTLSVYYKGYNVLELSGYVGGYGQGGYINPTYGPLYIGDTSVSSRNVIPVGHWDFSQFTINGNTTGSPGTGGSYTVPTNCDSFLQLNIGGYTRYIALFI